MHFWCWRMQKLAWSLQLHTEYDSFKAHQRTMWLRQPNLSFEQRLNFLQYIFKWTINRIASMVMLTNQTILPEAISNLTQIKCMVKREKFCFLTYFYNQNYLITNEPFSRFDWYYCRDNHHWILSLKLNL